MILAEGAEDFHGFLFEHCLQAPVRFSRSDTSGYYGGMIFAESAEDVLGFHLVHFLPAPVRFSRSDTQWLLWRDDPR